MPYHFWRKYGEAATVNFPLWEIDGVDFRTDATFVSGDLNIMKDEGAEGTTDNLPTDEGRGYSLILSATEMTCKRAVIYIVDQTAAKAWLDEYIVIETYGHANAMHAFNLDYDFTGHNETLKLKKLEVENDAGDAVIFRSTDGNGTGFVITGNGVGDGLSVMGGTGVDASGIRVHSHASSGGGGIYVTADGGDALHCEATSPSSGHGAYFKGLGTGKCGIYAVADNGNGMYLYASGNNAGLRILGSGTQHGIDIAAGTTGNGIYCRGGATSGNGVVIVGAAGNGNGIVAAGNGTGAGVKIDGGATGDGLNIEGGSTSGNGIDVTTIDGHGVNIDVSGDNKHGVNIDADGVAAAGIRSSATSQGMLLEVQGTGAGLQCQGHPLATNVSGITCFGKGTGHGIMLGCPGPATSGNGLNITGGYDDVPAVKIDSITSMGAPAIEVSATGIGEGIKINGG